MSYQYSFTRLSATRQYDKFHKCAKTSQNEFVPIVYSNCHFANNNLSKHFDYQPLDLLLVNLPSVLARKKILGVEGRGSKIRGPVG